MRPEAATLPEGTVTVLSTDLVGSAPLNQRLGDEAATAVERELAALAHEQVEKQRGVVVKDTGDGLMVAFQSARRAVACAQEIQRAVARRNRSRPDSAVQLRVGLHTGEVLNEAGGLHGETLIIAKRIEAVAPAGRIFASDTVRGVLGTARGELQDRGEFALKGIDASWHLWELPWADAALTGVLSARERTPFVARDQERARLLRAVERARDGVGALVLIGGEAGVGKTRLVEETAAEARRLGLRVLTGHCVDQQGALPYLPIVEHFEEVARQLSPEALRAALGENAPEVAKLVPGLRQRYADIPEPVALPPEQERRYLLHGLLEFVERNARAAPLLLVYEDLHWVDESTLLWIQHLAQRVSQIPVLAVGTYRDTDLQPGCPLAAELPELLRQRLAEEVLLGPLSEAGVASLLAGRAGSAPPPQLVALLHAETEGNPFFVEEVFHHLHEAGKLFDEAGRWRSGVQIADTDVPRSVGLVIGQRLERVSEDCRRVLTTAAVAGKTFRFDLLARFHGVDQEKLLDALEEAVRASLIADVSSGREARYAFVHEQIRQTLLSLLSTARRQRLHLRMADALEALHAREADAPAAEIAYHLLRAGAAADGGRTANWLVRAAERALGALAFEDALRALDDARSVLPEHEVEGAVRVLRLRAHAFRGLGRIDEALVDLGHALEIVQSDADRDAVLTARARLKLDLFRGHEAIADLDSLLVRAQRAGDRAREVEILLMRSRGLYILSLDEPGYAEKTRASYEATYALAREIGNKRAMCQALIPTIWFLDYRLEYHDEAVRNSDEATALARELGDEDLQIEAASARLRLMELREAHPEALRIRERLEARRDPLRLKEHLFGLMWQYWLRGEFEQCVATCDEGIALSAQLGSPPVQYPTIKALALIDLGRFDEAWASLQEEVADEAHPFGRCMRELGMACWLEALGALDRAEAKAHEVLEEAARLSRTWMQSFMADLLGVIAARRGKGEASVHCVVRTGLPSGPVRRRPRRGRDGAGPGRLRGGARRGGSDGRRSRAHRRATRARDGPRAGAPGARASRALDGAPRACGRRPRRGRGDRLQNADLADAGGARASARSEWGRRRGARRPARRTCAPRRPGPAHLRLGAPSGVRRRSGHPGGEKPMTTTLRTGSARDAGMLPERVERARERCAGWVKEGRTPALSVCVARRGVIVLHEAWGVLGPEQGAPPLALDSIFPITSVTKPITATLAMQLVEDGLLGLNRPAKHYLPELSGDGADEILVHHLLTHTSGYPWHTDRPMLEHAARKLQAGFAPPPCPEGQHPTIHRELSFYWDAPRVAPVGEVMIYSAVNYTLLGEIVRRLSGRGLEAQARERLFDPLGMHDSYFVVPASESARVVQRAHDVPFGDPNHPILMCIGSRQRQETPDAQAGMFSTPYDMVVFGQTILNRGRYGDARIVSPAAVAAMTRDQIPGLQARLFDKRAAHASWGYGWAVESPSKWAYFHGSLAPLGTLAHPGSGGAMFWIDPAHELVGAYFEVTARMSERFEPVSWSLDLFQNVITSAVED